MTVSVKKEDASKAACKLSLLSNFFTQSGDVVLSDRDKLGLASILDEIREIYDSGELA